MRYKIDGVEMPVATDFEPETNDLYGDNTGRDEAGYNHLDLIRPNVRKWKIKHENLTLAELNQIKEALNPLGFNFTGLHTGGVVTCNCYGNIKGIKCVYYGDDENDSRWDANVSIIEN